MVSHFLAAILGIKENIKFLLASLRLLTNSINPSNNPLQRACATLKLVPKATSDSELVPKVYQRNVYCIHQKIDQ